MDITLTNSPDGAYLIDPAARAAAYELKARYFYYIDTRQFDRLRTLFTPDARVEGYGFAPDGTIESFLSGVEEFLDGRASHHQGYMPMLRAESDSVIRARWSMRDYLTWEAGTKPYRGDDSAELSGFDAYGYYEEEYRRVEGGLAIQFMRLTRLRVDLLYGDRLAVLRGSLPPVVEWLP